MNSNSIQELADLDPLAGCKGLTHLVLMDNPVTRKEVCTSRTTNLGYGAMRYGAVCGDTKRKEGEEVQYGGECTI